MDQPRIAKRFIALFPDYIQDLFDTNQREAGALLKKADELAVAGNFRYAMINYLDAADKARVNSKLQDKAMTGIEEIFGDASKEILPYEADLISHRIRTLKKNRSLAKPVM